MHDAPTALLTDAYTEDEYVGGPAARDRRAHGRSAGAPGRARIGRLPRVDAAVRRQAPAAAPGHAAPRPDERVLSRRRQGADEQLLRGGRARWASACCTTPRSWASTSRMAASDRCRCSTRRPARVRRREGRGARGRRVRVESRLAERNLGRRRGQLHHPRHAVQHGHGAEADARRRGAAGRRPARSATRSPSMRARRSSTAASSRGSIRCRSGSSSTARRALLRRGRGLLAEALRDLGAARRAAARSDRVFDRRREGRRPLHAVGVSADSRGLDSPSSRGCWTCRRTRSMRTVDGVQSRGASRERSTTRCSTTAGPTA